MILETLLLFVLGLAFGSFIAAYTYRLPKGISIQKGRSFCPHCHNSILWYDNVPLLSYFILAGRCRHCHKRISKRNPLIEGSTAVGFVIIGSQSFQSPLALVINLLIFCMLVMVFVIDLEYQIIPDGLVFALLISLYSLLIITSSYSFYTHLAWGFLSSLTLLTIHLITRGKGMGLGDVKFAVFGGTFLGSLSFIWLMLSFLTGAIVGIILILFDKAKMKSHIAFGPFLIVGMLMTLIWGEKLVSWLF